MTEDELVTAIIDMARLLGVTTAHFRPARVIDRDGATRWVTAVQGDGKGFPDLVLAGPGGVAFREVKVGSNKATPEQMIWLSVLTSAGADAAIWHERDWHSGRIEDELRELAGKQPRKPTPQPDPQTPRKGPAWLKNGGRGNG
jgi:hypothetical protein